MYMDTPLQFTGGPLPDLRVKQERMESPVPSCLSVKSEMSMAPPLVFRGGTLPDLRVKQERMESPVPSCLSVKSEMSMDPPLVFRGGTLPDLRVKQERMESPVPSCLSVKSEMSMDPPLVFRGGNLADLRVKQERMESPVPSCLSVKSEMSMAPPLVFTGGTLPDLRVKQERMESPVPSCLSVKSEMSMDPPLVFRGGTLPDLSASVLTEDQFRCSVCSEALREPVSIPCGHSYCRQCISTYWAQPSLEGYNVCPECSKRFSTLPELSINTALTRVLQAFQRAGYSPALPAQTYAGAGDVPCDICAGPKHRAIKSCLTCSASYCEGHVRQHYTVPALQRHLLAEVRGDQTHTDQLDRTMKMEDIKEASQQTLGIGGLAVGGAAGAAGAQAGLGAVGTGPGAAPPTADPEKRKLIQQQLVLLLHAHKCHRREQANGEVRQWNLPHCRTMKNVLNHMTHCQAGKSCQVAHCASSREIISHWNNCTRHDCPVCLLPGSLGTVPGGQPSTPNLNPPSQIDPSSIERAYAALGLTYQGNQMPQQPPQGNMANQGLPGQPSMRSLNTMGGNPMGVNGGVQQPNQQSNLLPDAMQHNSMNAQSLMNDSGVGSLGSMPTATPPSAPGMRKSWHEDITQDLRNHLVHKLVSSVQAIFPTPDPAALKDRRIENLVAYARKVEGDMYESANSRAEYYHLLAKKIYKIQKELEEKRRTRLQKQGMMPNQPGMPPTGLPQGPPGMGQPPMAPGLPPR
ncbi:uncharacterized protein LOC124479250 isoform X3 [Hypomesus transpacificus]|uniref:uncharacterized protein LOC124479250 isoform X3 n=1 Tax=Hypomesus transpacificus TaxID=137520 RepID=UPI001F08274E|nr:uncharacterized protein LOC124479250 isoform X3 [Hypomesus transpacificus]